MNFLRVFHYLTPTAKTGNGSTNSDFAWQDCQVTTRQKIRNFAKLIRTSTTTKLSTTLCNKRDAIFLSKRDKNSRQKLWFQHLLHHSLNVLPNDRQVLK